MPICYDPHAVIETSANCVKRCIPFATRQQKALSSSAFGKSRQLMREQSVALTARTTLHHGLSEPRDQHHNVYQYGHGQHKDVYQDDYET